MPSKKRKSDCGQQNVISKFFKPLNPVANGGIAKRPKKKVPVIQIVDDNEDHIEATALHNSDATMGESIVDISNTTENVSHNKTIHASVTKLAKFALVKSGNNDKKRNNNDSDTLVEITCEKTKATKDSSDKKSVKQYSWISRPSMEFATSSTATTTRETKDHYNVKSPTTTTRCVGEKVSYTPLEQQIVDIKKKHGDVLLFVECGYKYRFFGQDAEIAAKELNIFSHMDHNFMTASIPVHRLNVHLTRLLEKGYKVGIVKQVETAALKAVGDNKHALFVREITNVYTKATFLDRDDQTGTATNGNFILCIDETFVTSLQNHVCSVVVVNPNTNEVTYAQYMCNQDLHFSIETIFNYFKPCEIVLPKHPMKSECVEKLVYRYTKNSVTHRVLVERYDKNQYSTPTVSAKRLKESLGNVDLCLCCDGLHGSIVLLTAYLEQFGLSGILENVKNYKMFCRRNDSMMLDGITYRNLELFENNSDGGVKGCLFWTLDHTCTPFGRRLLKTWLGNPLIDRKQIEQRLDAIGELNTNWESPFIVETRKELSGCSDLEHALTIICLRKASPERFVKYVEFTEKIRLLFLRHNDESSRKFNNSLLKNLYRNISSKLGTRLQDLLKLINREAAMSGRKENVFRVNENFYPEVFRVIEKIKEIENCLERYRKNDLPKILKKFSVEYKCISGVEYLIEVKNSELKLVPKDWIKVSGTKQFCRYRSPFIDDCFKELCRNREELTKASNNAWMHFLDEFSLLYQSCRDVIDCLACFDCLMSLSIVARQPGYCRPSFDDSSECIEITGGRHPVVETLLTGDKQYVANDIKLSRDKKVMLISGPNMGGKSSFMKQVAINCILAHMGSYIAASHAKFSILDGIYTRMGASDNVVQHKSTFMVELEEAARIIRQATDKSLVILDELGRGTSTFDGMAIASATLKYFVEDVHSFTLFVSHYPILSEFEEKYSTCTNYHMGYMTVQPTDESVASSTTSINNSKHACNDDGIEVGGNKELHPEESLVFLYKLTRGLAGKSYGLNVARLAHIDESIIKKAATKSKDMEISVSIQRKFRQLVESINKDTEDVIVENIKKLSTEES